jgi:lipoprotein-releasing system ATP-binding protein
MNKTVLQATGLGKTFQLGQQSVSVLRDINLTLQAGERMAIVGSSGSGKSTLLHVLGGLDRADLGQVSLLETPYAALNTTELGRLRNQSLGFIYQFHHLLPEFSALENVAMPLLIRRMPPHEALRRAQVMLDNVGLGQRLQHKPAELSGGERQRAAIARALVTEPACLLADEPTGNLDRQTAQHVFELMLDLNARFDTALVIVTHDMALAQQVGVVYRLVDGQLRPEGQC